MSQYLGGDDETSDLIDRLAQALSDSREVNWEEILNSGPEASQARIIRNLQTISAVGTAYRSASADIHGNALPFQRWGHLNLREKIGEGSSAEVYLAHDETLGRDVALKLFIPDPTADPLKSVTLIEEARRLARVRHEHVVRVFGADVHEGRLGFWMEYVGGESLEKVLERRGGPFPTQEVVTIGARLAQALGAVHRAGLLHRDVSSGNVIQDPEGNVYLMDLGIGAVATSGGAAHRTQRAGTPLYMAPETLLEGRSSIQSDIYGLGVLLFHLTSGAFPVEAETVDELKSAHRRTRRLDLERQYPELPPEFLRVLERCLDPDPQERFQSAPELESALTKLAAKLNGAPRSHTRVLGFLGLGVLVLIAAIWALRLMDEKHEQGLPMSASLAILDISHDDDSTSNIAAQAIASVLPGLIEQLTPCRVVGKEFIGDVKRRIPEDSKLGGNGPRNLALLDFAKVNYGLRGHVRREGSVTVVSWEIIRSREDKPLAQARVSGKDVFGVVHGVAAQVLPAMANEMRFDPPADSLLLASLPSHSAPALAAYAQGLAAMEKGNLAEAHERLLRAVSEDSSFALAWAELVNTTTDFPLRRQYIEKVWALRARLGPKDRLRLESERAAANARHLEALQIREEILARWPDDYRALLDASRSLTAWWFNSEALNLIDKGLAFFPDDVNLNFMRWMCLRGLGRCREEVDATRAWVTVHPKSPEVWNEMGIAYLRLGLTDSAEAVIRHGFEMDPNPPYEDLALCAFQRGDVDRAIAILDSCLSLPRYSARFGVQIRAGGMVPGIATLYAEKGQLKRAREELDRAAGLDSDPALYLTMEHHWRRLLLREGEHAAMLNDFGSNKGLLVAVTSRPYDRRGFEWTNGFQQVQALEGLGRTHEASLLADTLLANPLEEVGDYRMRRILLEAMRARMNGDYDSALRSIDQVERNGAPFGTMDLDVRLEHARTLELASRLEEAATILNDLLRIYGGHSHAHYDLARIYETLGRTGSARRERKLFLQAWAEADPGLIDLEIARSQSTRH